MAQNIASSRACLAWVRAISQAYVELDRSQHDAEQLVDLKLKVSFWRARMLDEVFDRQPHWQAKLSPDELENEQEVVLQIMLFLDLQLTPRQLERATQQLPPPLNARLRAAQGITTAGFPEHDDIAGPGVELNIVANRGSGTPFEKWREDERLSRYHYEKDGVRYRGILFRPGDILLANVNLDGNGVYTSLSEPRSCSSHAAYFAMLEHAGRKLPVVIETYEKGVRPVPLSVFLGGKFCSYVEVFRHREFQAGHAAAINQAAAEFISKVRGYNFDCEDQDRNYMSCTSVGRFLHQAAGLCPSPRVSRLEHPRIRRNLGKIGFRHFAYFGPVDFLLSDCLYCVGTVDNNQVKKMVARELIDRRFQRHFANSDIDIRRFPFPYRLNLWGLRHMRRKTLIGRLIGRLEGFSADTLPKGPDDLLALIVLAEKQVGKCIRQVHAAIADVLAECEHLDISRFGADARVQDALQQHFNLPWLPQLSIEAARAEKPLVDSPKRL